MKENPCFNRPLDPAAGPNEKERFVIETVNLDSHLRAAIEQRPLPDGWVKIQGYGEWGLGAIWRVWALHGPDKNLRAEELEQIWQEDAFRRLDTTPQYEY